MPAGLDSRVSQGCGLRAPTGHRNIPLRGKEPERAPEQRDQKWTGEAGAGSRNVLIEFPIIDKYSRERKAGGDRHPVLKAPGEPHFPCVGRGLTSCLGFHHRAGIRTNKLTRQLPGPEPGVPCSSHEGERGGKCPRAGKRIQFARLGEGGPF